MNVPLNGRNWHKEHIVENVEKIYYICKGRCKINIGGEEYIVSQGEMIAIPSNRLLSFMLVDEDEPTEQHFLHLDAKIGAKSIFDFIELNSYVVKADELAIRYFFSELTGEYADPLEAELSRRAAATELLLYFIKRAGGRFKPQTNKSGASLRQIMYYIDEHIIDGDCNVKTLAKKANMNENHFIGEFAKQFGVTPGKYLRAQRVERAKRFLEETDLPVNIIAASLGYSSYEAMSKTFKNSVGVSPNEYRRTIRRRDMLK